MKAAIFTLEGALFCENKTLNPSILIELKAQKKGGRVIVLTTNRPENDHKKILAELAEIGVVDPVLIHGKISVAELTESYQIAAVFDNSEDFLRSFKEEDIPSFFISEGKICSSRGKAPKIGKGIGRKPKAPTKVVPVRLPLAMVQEHGIDGNLLKKLVNEYIDSGGKT